MTEITCTTTVTMTTGTATMRRPLVLQPGHTRRDLMPGHVHTLGILRHSRSRHDRDNAETFGKEGELGNDALLINPTGDPLLDAKMMEEQEDLAKRRKHYASSEDEYAGLMSQRDKQWIINIQLNQ